MIQRSTVQLLRFHFSLFLLPVFLFALSEVHQIPVARALLVFFILHGLVYPASNGYNSYMDRDTSPIGGLAHPMQPTRQLFWCTVLMDAAACLLSLLVPNKVFSLGILFYIIASRAYSNRTIRLKQYPVLGFGVVFFCQGALVFICTQAALSDIPFPGGGWLAPLIASLLIGGSYPLTQVYQHEADARDGVRTISMLLGKRGTFLFSAFLFGLATTGLYFLYEEQGRPDHFKLFLGCTAPMVLFFCYWFYRVWRNEAAANFKYSLLMNILSTLCTLIFFSILIYTKQLEQDRFHRYSRAGLLSPAGRHPSVYAVDLCGH